MLHSLENGPLTSRRSASVFAARTSIRSHRGPRVREIASSGNHIFIWTDSIAAFLVPIRDLPASLSSERAQTILQDLNNQVGNLPAVVDTEAVPARATVNSTQRTPQPARTTARSMQALIRWLTWRPFDGRALNAPDFAIALVAVLCCAMPIGFDRIGVGSNAEFSYFGAQILGCKALALLVLEWIIWRATDPTARVARDSIHPRRADLTCRAGALGNRAPRHGDSQRGRLMVAARSSVGISLTRAQSRLGPQAATRRGDLSGDAAGGTPSGFGYRTARLESVGIAWGIVTNKPAWLTEPLLERLALRQRARVVVSGDSILERKPHPAPLLHAAERLGFAPAQCIYIGDAERDVLAARSARMKVFVALFGYIAPDKQPRQWPATGWLDTPQAMSQLLERLTPSEQGPPRLIRSRSKMRKPSSPRSTTTGARYRAT